MFEPQRRLSIYDIVRPPDDFDLDCLVATTYSAALDTVLSLPAALLTDLPGMAQRRPGIFTAAELAALKRICGRTVIFCQAAAIHPAEHLPPAVIEAEDMVHEVLAPNGGNFHPKVWLIRFLHRQTDRPLLRAAIMSRNLTADKSWDTGVVFDGRPATNAAKPNDLSKLLTRLPELCLRPLDKDRRKTVTDLARQIETVRWKMPDGTTNCSFHLLGDKPRRGWTQPKSERLAIVSPFLGMSAIRSLAATSRASTLIVSRPDALERCWPALRDEFDRHMVLAPPEDPLAAPTPAGLHAKLLLWENGPKTFIAVGSMNMTSAAMDGRNVEFMVKLDCTSAIGPAGVDALMDQKGMGAVLEEFSPDPENTLKPLPQDDRVAKAALIAADLHLECVQSDDGWELTLVSARPSPRLEELLPNLRFRPATLGKSQAVACAAPVAAGQSARFPGTLELFEITGFTVFEADGPEEPISFILNLEVLGVDSEARRGAALKALLPDAKTFSDFMMVLLGDLRALEVASSGKDGNPPGAPWSTAVSAGLLEMLIRCAADEPQRLRSIEQTLQSLGPEQLQSVTSTEFRSLWASILHIARSKK